MDCTRVAPAEVIEAGKRSLAIQNQSFQPPGVLLFYDNAFAAVEKQSSDNSIREAKVQRNLQYLDSIRARVSAELIGL